MINHTNRSQLKLTQYIELIDKWYFEFLEERYGVDGFEKAKTLFHKTIDLLRS